MSTRSISWHVKAAVNRLRWQFKFLWWFIVDIANRR